MQGYLMAVSASAYSYVSMLQRFGPIMNPGGAAVSLTYLASEKIIPGGSAVLSSCTLMALQKPQSWMRLKEPITYVLLHAHSPRLHGTTITLALCLAMKR